MKKTKTRKKMTLEQVLKLINVLLVFVVLIILGYRLIYYYKLENDKPLEISIAEEIKTKKSLVDMTKGLVFDEEKNTYTYKGKVSNNYLEYEGFLFRIVGIDENGNVKLVTEEDITILISGLEKGFLKSYVYNYLNDKSLAINFLSLIASADKYLVSNSSCIDNVSDIENITCEDVNYDSSSSLLSLYDYSSAGGKNSYLNNGSSFALLTTGDFGYYYVTNSGDVSLNKDSTKAFGIRPVITIDGTKELIDGSGTKNDPYKLMKDSKKTSISSVKVYDYIKYSGYTWQVVSFDDKKVKVVLDGVLKEDDKDYKTKFSSSTSNYSTSKNTLGYYLNNDFYKSLENKDYIIKSSWYIGKSEFSNLDYKNYLKKGISAYVGLLSLGELTITDFKDTFTITRSYEDNNLIYVIDENNHLYSDIVTKKHLVRPSINLNNKLSIVKGSGKKNDPYVLGGVKDEKK